VAENNSGGPERPRKAVAGEEVINREPLQKALEKQGSPLLTLEHLAEYKPPRATDRSTSTWPQRLTAGWSDLVPNP